MKIFLKIILLLLVPLLSAAQQDNPYPGSLHGSLSGARSDTARMEAFSMLGSYYLLEDRDSAGFYLDTALAMATRLHLKLNEASILNGMGVIHMQQEKFSRSLELYLKAIHIAKDPSIEKTIWRLPPGQNPTQARMLVLSRSYDLIGLLNAYTGNWTDNIKNQMKNYREAEQYANASGDSGQIATVIFHMGIAYMNEGKMDSALIFLKEAQSRFTHLNDPQLGRSFIYLGETYVKMDNPQLAAQTMLQAIMHLNKTNDYVHRGLAALSLSRVYADLKKTDSALYYARESFKIFDKRRDPAWKRDASNLLATYFDRLGEADSATAYLILAKSLSDSLNTEERKNLLAFQDVLIDEQAKLEKLEKEKIETREKLRISLLASGIVVFTVIALILYRNNRARKKTNEILQQRNEQIEHTLDQLRSTQAQLIQSEKMASLGELTAGIAHEIQNPLNFVNNFSEINKELANELKTELKTGNAQSVSELADAIIDNAEKITHHGKRADAIIKGMLQHSQTNTGQKSPTDLNALCREYLKLAYHGLRAKDKSFNAGFETDFDPDLSPVNIVPQDIGRVLLNLINNAFYAVGEKAKTSAGHYEPVVTVSTRKAGSQVEISVRDNGNGIPEHIRDKIFQPFFTTKPTGQGTGLGLSLGYDIVKAHGGTLTVESKEGEYSNFIMQLPTGQR
jgi:signal transduction histidine kinase